MQEVIGSTPIFSTEVNEDKPAGTTQVVAAGFVLYVVVDAKARQLIQKHRPFISCCIGHRKQTFLRETLNILLIVQLSDLADFD